MNTIYLDSPVNPLHQAESHAAQTRTISTDRTHEPSHPALIGYLFWIIGFTGAHRFYFGKPVTGTIWFLTGGLFLIGWIIDVFFIPAMSDQANRRYPPRQFDYSAAWVLLIFLGIFGAHRFYTGKILTGVLYLVTGGLLGIGVIYDVFTLNDQIATGA